MKKILLIIALVFSLLAVPSSWAGSITFPSSKNSTNAILTTPTINTPTINTPTITGGSISGTTGQVVTAQTDATNALSGSVFGKSYTSTTAVIGTVYTNNTGRPIFLFGTADMSGASSLGIVLNGVQRAVIASSTSFIQVPFFFVVPTGHTYAFAFLSGASSISSIHIL